MSRAEIRLPVPTWGIGFERPNLKTGLPLHTLPPSGQFIVPLLQHAGSVAESLVKVGDKVFKGQPLGEIPAGSQGAAIHAPTSGNVSAIEEHEVPGGRQPCVVIKADGADERWNGCNPVPDPFNRSRAELIDAVSRAGIVGLGGAMFPTARKLETSSPVHTLVLNGVECEPRINCDDGLIRDRAAEILTGGQIMLHMLDAAACIVAVKSDTSSAIQKMRDALEELSDDRFSLALVPPVYPAGGERQLLQMLTGKEIPSGGLPRDIGCICQNVATAAALHRFMQTGEPLISRIVTVTGSGVAGAMNIEARLGMPVAKLIEFAGGYTTDTAQLIMGGPMMGIPLQDDSVPVTKATNCIYVHDAKKSAKPPEEKPCIRCADCATACPVALSPQLLLQASRGGDFELLDNLGLADCIECGCCDYVCPSNIALTSQFRHAKREQRAIEFERRRGALAEQRFAARTARLERDEAEAHAGNNPAEDVGNRAEALRQLLKRVKTDGDERGHE